LGILLGRYWLTSGLQCLVDWLVVQYRMKHFWVLGSIVMFHSEGDTRGCATERRHILIWMYERIAFWVAL
jgi:hypothetical protein